MPKTQHANEIRQAMLPAVQISWDYQRCRRMARLKYHRQNTIGIYIVDLDFAEDRLSIEVDGGIHIRQVNALVLKRLSFIYVRRGSRAFYSLFLDRNWLPGGKNSVCPRKGRSVPGRITSKIWFFTDTYQSYPQG